MIHWIRVIAPLFLALFVTGCVTVSDGRDSKVDPVEASIDNMELGVQYMKRGEYERALAKLQRAIELDDGNGGAHAMLGILYERIDDIDKADYHYRRAVTVDRDNGEALNNYGVFLCKNDRMKESEKYFRRAASSTGYRTPAAALTNAGSCARKRGDAKAAEEHLRLALRWDRGFDLALFHLADLNYENGDALTARAFLERYKAKNDLDATVLWLAIRIEQALGDEQAMSGYAATLRRKYPGSNEAAELARLEYR